MPLRFPDLKKVLTARSAVAQWTSLVLMFILLTAGVVVFYSLSIRWFKVEFQRAVLEVIQQNALRTSHAIGSILYKTMSSGGILTQDNEQHILQALDEYLRKNPTVVGALIADPQGRIRIVSLSMVPQPPAGPTLQHMLENARALRGADAEAVINNLTAEQSNLYPMPLYLKWNERPVGQLILLIDRTLTTSQMDLAITHMTGRLTMLLGAVTMVLALAILLIRRQQRIARRLSEQRSEVERLAYVGTLAAGLAHEIRNPLNALAMQIELLEEDVGEGAPELATPRLQHIRKGLAGVEHTVHDFLTYATPGKQQPRMIELASELTPLCEESTQGIPDLPVRMECIAAPGLMAWCDPHALRQVLSNLISNALRAQKKKVDSAHVRIEASRNGTWVDILVDDAGPGVPPDQHARVFDCFYTTQSEGTGLGLPIARRLAEMNGGQLLLDTHHSPLGGARFRLRLSARPLTPNFE